MKNIEERILELCYRNWSIHFHLTIDNLSSLRLFDVLAPLYLALGSCDTRAGQAVVDDGCGERHVHLQVLHIDGDAWLGAAGDQGCVFM